MILKLPSLEKLLYDFTHLPLGDKKIRCPYWKNKIEKKVFGPCGGKGSPLQIIEATREEAQNIKINLDHLSKSEILELMQNKKIGIDCSGFVYQMLDVLDKEKGGEGIVKKVIGLGGQGITKTNVQCLTDNINSLPVLKIKDIKIGDLLRLKNGKHLAIIIRIKKKGKRIVELTYAHSSNATQISGVHTAKIKIKNSNGSIKKQIWPEKLQDKTLFVKKYFNPHTGDGIRRPRWSK